MPNLTVGRLKEVLSYNQCTGEFARKNDRYKRSGPPGCINTLGYQIISIDNVRYHAHRLAWLYVNGEWPQHWIDHVNGDRADNRLANLRDVHAALNNQNRRASQKNSKLGLLGVVQSPNGKFKAQICVGKKQKHLGTFATAEEAQRSYLTAKRQVHEGCTV
jgi:hypothetical protein